VLAIGDAPCHFIPVFGKGMSVAAQEAVILDRLLAEDVPMKRLASLPSKAPSRRRGVLPSPISCTPPRVALARPTSRSACNTGGFDQAHRAGSGGAPADRPSLPAAEAAGRPARAGARCTEVSTRRRAPFRHCSLLRRASAYGGGSHARRRRARTRSLSGNNLTSLEGRDSHDQPPDVAANPCTEAQGVGCGEPGKSGVGNPVDDDP
jgi:hypothetical protein